MLLHLSESQPLAGLKWEDLSAQVRTLATALRSMGVRPGDRVVAYMPNIPAAVVALLATSAIGAVWASCSPDFGSRGVLDRLQQLKPKVLFCVDGYRYGGKPFDRRGELAEIIGALEGLEHIIYLPRLDPASPARPRADARLWSEVMNRPPVPAAGFQFEQVPFEHPLWILFSSGTTGLPKAIVQGHGGTLLEQYKAITFHMDMHPGDRMFFFTTTGWMMWNFLVSAILVRAVPVLYDGNPAYPDADVLWKMAQDCGAAYFGASPTLRRHHGQGGHRPGEKIRPVEAARDHAGGLTGDARTHRLVLPQREAEPVDRDRQRRHRRVHRPGRRRADAARACGRDPGALPRRRGDGIQRSRREGRRRGR